MRIATLQFAPRVGEVEDNIGRALDILEKHEGKLQNLDLLVLPEMAFTGQYLSSLVMTLEVASKTECPFLTPPTDLFIEE